MWGKCWSSFINARKFLLLLFVMYVFWLICISSQNWEKESQAENRAFKMYFRRRKKIYSNLSSLTSRVTSWAWLFKSKSISLWFSLAYICVFVYVDALSFLVCDRNVLLRRRIIRSPSLPTLWKIDFSVQRTRHKYIPKGKLVQKRGNRIRASATYVIVPPSLILYQSSWRFNWTHCTAKI